MMRKPGNAFWFMMLIFPTAALSAAEAYSQQVQAAGKGSRALHSANLSVGAGMDFWSGDWGGARINRWGPTLWASTELWRCLGVNAEGYSLIVGGNRIASDYKLFDGEGGLTCTLAAGERFKPILKGDVGFASLSQPGNGTDHLHSTYVTWSVGAGVEIHTRGPWWTRVEYTYDALPNFHSSVSNQNHTLNPRGLSFGMSYHFGATETSFPEPVAVAQETQNLPGPYTANQRHVGGAPDKTSRTDMRTPNVTTPDTVPTTPAPQINVPAPATAPEAAPPKVEVPAQAPVPTTPAPLVTVPAPSPAPETPASNDNVTAPANIPATPAPKAKAPIPAPLRRTPPPKTKEPAPAPAPETSASNVKGTAPATIPGPPSGKISAGAPSRFVLGPSDVIQVHVANHTELSQTVIVSPDGAISLRLLDNVHVGGMTAGEVAHEIRSQLTGIVANPQVTVSVVAVHSKQVFVMGQVAKPGGYPLLGRLSVLQVIGQAGGLTPQANRDAIMIVREGKDGTAKIRYSYNDVVLLRPGDIVVVP